VPTGFPDYYGGLTLPVTVQEGGTGQTSVTLNALLIGQGSGAMAVSNVGSAGQVLQIPSGGGAPAFAAVSAATLINNIVITPITSGLGIALHGSTATPISPQIQLIDDTAALLRGEFGLAEAAGVGLTATVAGDIYLLAETGKLLLGTGTAVGLTINQSAVCTLAVPLAIASGGTGAASLEAAGLPQILAEVDLTGQTATIGTTTLGTTPAAGMYRVTGNIYTTGGVGLSSVVVTISWTQNGNGFSNPTAFQIVNAGANALFNTEIPFFADAATNVTYAVVWTSGGGGDAYDIHLRLEAIS